MLFSASMLALVLGGVVATWLALPRAQGAASARPARGHWLRRALRSALLGIVLPWSAGMVALACFAGWMLAHGQHLGFAAVWLGFVQAWSLASVVFLLHRVSTRHRPPTAGP